mmetsp:Transcript_34898/g.88417  ORF Transcript_34898/g.88417 Transcript_34898/m.88417 type:complete len:213 (-) Transcript_34898:471-1109(-)
MPSLCVAPVQSTPLNQSPLLYESRSSDLERSSSSPAWKKGMPWENAMSARHSTCMRARSSANAVVGAFSLIKSNMVRLSWQPMKAMCSCGRPPYARGRPCACAFSPVSTLPLAVSMGYSLRLPAMEKRTQSVSASSSCSCAAGAPWPLLPLGARDRPVTRPWKSCGAKGPPPSAPSRRRSLNAPSPVPARFIWPQLRPRALLSTSPKSHASP